MLSTMKDTISFENLSFHTYIRAHNYHTDQRLGAPRHFFAYMETGNCRIVSEDITIEACAGEMFYIPKGLVYHSYWYSRDKVQFKSFGFQHFPESASRQYLLQKLECSEAAAALMRELPTEQSADSVLLSRFYGAVAAVLPFMKYKEPDPKKAVLEKAARYILNNEHCRVSDIARHCLISESALYDIFKKEAGCTPNILRQQVLCEKAALLLSTTDRSVQDISDALGFSSASYFRKIMRQHTGKTPRQIRKDAKGI